MALVNSVHLGQHWQEHLHFFKHFRFLPPVEQQVARFSKLLRPGFLAVHLRPYLFRAEGEAYGPIEPISHLFWMNHN